MKKHTIQVTKAMKDAILVAVDTQLERAKDQSLTYKAEESFDEWVRVNKGELETLKEAHLLCSELGFNYRWVVADEQDSAE